MGTTEYFHKQLHDAIDKKTLDVEIGTSNYAGNGPQMYINCDGKALLLSNESATEFCQAVARIANYLGLEPANLDGQWVLRRD